MQHKICLFGRGGAGKPYTDEIGIQNAREDYDEH